MLEKQTAAELAASLEPAAAEPLLSAWMDRLLAGRMPRELYLDLLETARKHGSARRWPARWPPSRRSSRQDDLGPFRVSLHGGSVDRGRHVFFSRSDASCLRCHKVDGAGSDTGPDLSGAGRGRTREALLESIVFPSKAFPPASSR